MLKLDPIKLLIYAFIIAMCAYLLGFCWGVAHADEIDDIIPAVIMVESGGRADAVSPCGAIGVMQISACVLLEWNANQRSKYNIIIRYGELDSLRTSYSAGWEYDMGADIYMVEDLYNRSVNMKIGTWYLRRLKDHYLKGNYTVERMLAAYNGGITRLRKNNYDISKMPKETRDYVKKVIKIYAQSH